MAEQLQHHQEHEKQPEQERAAEQHEKRPEHHKEHQAEKKTESVEHIKSRVEREAISKENVSVESAGPKQDSPRIDKELKQLTFQRTLTHVRKKLGGPSRVVSKVVHQPVIDKLSQLGEKTIARPVSLFSGSLCALVGTSLAFYMAKHYGFHYNFLLFILLFVGGFILGTLAELVVNLLHRISLK